MVQSPVLEKDLGIHLQNSSQMHSNDNPSYDNTKMKRRYHWNCIDMLAKMDVLCTYIYYDAHMYEDI